MRGAGIALALAGATALAAGAAATAAPPKVILTLVDPTTTLSAEPPLAGAIGGEIEAQVFHHRVDSREHVRIGVDATGRPVSVVVVQRLSVTGTGDYLYSVPGPVISVVATPDSESEPGQRQDAIRWAGFATAKRLLGARARLVTAKAAPALPLRLALDATVDGRPIDTGASGRLDVRLMLRNATSVRAPTASATGELSSLVGALDRAHRGVFPAGGVAVTVRTPVDARTAFVEAPLRVEGELVFPAGRLQGAAVAGGTLTGNRLRFSVLLGDGLPLAHVVRVTGRAAGIAAPKLRVEVRSVKPVRTLAPPAGASSWAEALRLNPQLDSRRALEIAEDAFLRVARAAQYDTYLANPGPGGGKNRADYVYVTAPPRAGPDTPGSGGGLGAVGLVLALAGGLVVAAGLAVGWSHL